LLAGVAFVAALAFWLAPWPYWLFAEAVLFAFEFVAWRLFGPFALFRCPKCHASFPYATIMRASERAN